MAARTSSQDGLWSASSTWGGSAAPTTGDSASIGHHVTVSAADAACWDVTLTGTGTLTLSNSKWLTCRVLTIPAGTTVTVDAGANLNRESSGTTPYDIVLEGTIVSPGTPTAIATIGDAGGFGNAKITGSGTLTCTYTHFGGLSGSSRHHGRAQWERNMVYWGEVHATRMAGYIADWTAGGILDPVLTEGYYDQGRGMYNVADYTGNAEPWSSYAAAHLNAYRTGYITPNTGNIPAYWGFTKGLKMQWERTGLAAAKTAVFNIADNASYHPFGDVSSTNRSRECAYAIRDFIYAHQLGGSTYATRRLELVELAYGHIDYWVTRAWAGVDIQVSPFMFALTAFALIRDWEETADVRLVPALVDLADLMWTDGYTTYKSLRYNINPASVSEGGYGSPAPDLNMLIAPVFAFLYAQTGDTTARDRFDLLTEGHRYGDMETHGKQWDQSFFWSTEGMYWRYDITPPEPPVAQLLHGNLGRGW